MRFSRLFVFTGLLLFAVGCTSLFAQNSDKMAYAGLKQSKFANLPVLPNCMVVSVQRGDPSKGPAVLAGKLTAGCSVPWHWHSVAENLVMVSGTAKAEMKDGASQNLARGDFVYMPEKHAHQFTCTTACVIYAMPSGAFDIHYIDKDGKEIPVEEALKASPNHSGTAKKKAGM